MAEVIKCEHCGERKFPAQLPALPSMKQWWAFFITPNSFLQVPYDPNKSYPPEVRFACGDPHATVLHTLWMPARLDWREAEAYHE